MPTYKRLDLAGRGSALPAVNPEPLTGSQPFARHPAVEVMRRQNEIAPLSRRVVCSVGLRGDSEFRVPSTDPNLALLDPQTHPDRTTYYTIGRSQCSITPGCFLAVKGTCVPSGMCQVNQPVGPDARYVEDGVGGWIRVTVDWAPTSGATAQSVREIQLPSSL